MASKDNVAEYIGKKYNKLTIISDAGSTGYGRTLCVCRCDCGREVEKVLSDVKTAVIKSCWCLNGGTQISGEGHQSFKHGKKNHRLYSIMNKMKQRCYNLNHDAYERYGGAGVTICEEWRTDFMSFYDWAMSNGYKEELTIDRKENDKGYCPDNCRWVSITTQNRNKSNVRLITIEEDTKSLAEWLRDSRVSVTKSAFYHRVKEGMSDKEALLTPYVNKNTKVNKAQFIEVSKHMVTIDGQTKSFKDWCKHLGINIVTARTRYEKGMSDIEALTKPIDNSKKRRENNE